MEYLAHVSEDGLREQLLRDHLYGTAELAGEFADVFHHKSLGYLCGLLHDIGKYSGVFQKRIRGDGIKVDHSTAGALELKGLHAFWAAYCVAGHHAGLPDGSIGAANDGKVTPLKERLKKKPPDYQFFKNEIKVPPVTSPLFEIFNYDGEERGIFSVTFFIRMMYSCLVDADYLDTERFVRGTKRSYPYDSIETLKSRLDAYVAPWLSGQDKGLLNTKRTEILKACLEKGKEEQGIYYLTVPTGGGKTVSSMAFALNHALKYNLKRIIYVIPYTSIIEQNAEVFSNILGDSQVLEHHSNAEYSDSDKDELNLKQLAAENWDVPVVVTTGVQFFESLFASKSSKCRKLHNIAGSVLIFDEAQMLPADYLRPCLRAVNELVLNYGCTAVLCTATQPALESMLPKRLVRGEICPEADKQYEVFRRTVLVKEDDMTIDQLAERLESESQVLCILNTKAMVRRVFDKIDDKTGLFHLSTNMYPEHRKRVLKGIKERLAKGEPCRVVATSLVEAGVDLDFQTVYRELAGVDSVIQAAGRCNREGKRAAEDSVTHVFRFVQEERKSNISMKQNIVIAEQIMDEYEDMGSPAAVHEYFSRLFYVKGEGLDKKEILKSLNDCSINAIPFRAVANEFHIIQENTRMVMVAREPEAKELERQLRYGVKTRALMRKVGHYTVNVFEKTYEYMLAAGMLDEIDETIAILREGDRYSEEIGLKTDVSLGEGIFL